MEANPNEKFITLKLGITNCFLLPCREGFLLIDTSISKYYSRFLNKINEKGIELRQIRYVLLTHHHGDHTGFLHNLLEASGARLIVHRAALPFLAAGVNNEDMRGTTGVIRLLMRLRKAFHLNPVNNPVFLGDRDIIIEEDNDTILREIGVNAKIVCLPGHTADSIAVVCDDGTAFAGDAAMNMPLLAGLRHRPMVAEFPEKIIPCWERLKTEKVLVLCVSHGKKLEINKL